MTLLARFVQLEFTHSLGPAPGRYLVPAFEAPTGEDEAEAPAAPAVDPVTGVTRAVGSADVLAIDVVGAPPPRRGILFGRKAHDAPAGERRREVSLAMVTFVKSSIPLEPAGAQGLIERCRQSEEEQEAWIGEALAVINSAIRAYRAGGDPYVLEVSRQDPRAVRIGWGSAEEIFAGEWRGAFSPPPLPAPRVGRDEILRSQQLVAGVLAGRARVLDADDLIARALLDLDLGRSRGAALQLRAAVELLVAELRDESLPAGLRERVETLGESSALLERRAAEALRGELGAEAPEELARIAMDAGELLCDWRLASLA